MLGRSKKDGKVDDDDVMEFAMSPDSNTDKDGNLMMFSADLDVR